MSYGQEYSVLKRKAIDHFFKPVKKTSLSSKSIGGNHRGDDREIHPAVSHESLPVPGLSLYTDFVTQAEEKEIIGFLSDTTKCTWRTDLSRRTMHFGGTYCLMPRSNAVSDEAEPGILRAPDMPQELQWLIQRLVDGQIFQNGQRPQYCIVNEYTGKLGISAHTENFQFGEPVVGLSLLSACAMRFHELAERFDGSVRSGKAARARKTGRVVDLQLPSRSLVVMTGPSRWSWQHEIVRSAKGRGPGWKRVSLTFRFKP
ncbi:MAG: hypothetical protein Q9219_004064 [cf. Caloplaca sp. 3 TL-2023]